MFWHGVEICCSEFLVLILVFVPFLKEYCWYFVSASDLFSARVLLLKQKPTNGTTASIVQVNYY